MRNDEAWGKLFEKYGGMEKAEGEGGWIVSAKEMKEFREPRLMAKFDHESNLPALFREHSLGILPVSRGEYVVAPFRCYVPLKADTGPIVRCRLPDGVTSIDPGSITSEAVAINCAAAAGIFSDFLDEETLIPSVSGRMGSGAFSFRIVNSLNRREIPVRVDNAQIEIDAGFEGRGGLTLIEAKLDISDDFIARQLFYPFKTWEERVPKPVRLVYLVYSNGIFTLYEYAVDDSEVYNSLRLGKSRRYSVDDAEIRRDDIKRVLETVEIIPEPEELPFPQADSFERIINLCELLNSEGELTHDDITLRYDFTERQTSYYANSARYLGLVEKTGAGSAAIFSLSDEGRALFLYRLRERQLKLCEHILCHKVFQDVYRQWLGQGKTPDRDVVIAAMKNSGLCHIHGEATYRRRASTVLSWLNWIDRLFAKGLFALPPEMFR